MFRKISLGIKILIVKFLGLIFNNKNILIGIKLFKLSNFYLVFENLVWIIMVGFEFKIQIVLKQVFIFSSKLFHTSIKDYNLNR
jgi:hypothetical protein